MKQIDDVHQVCTVSSEKYSNINKKKNISRYTVDKCDECLAKDPLLRLYLLKEHGFFSGKLF